MRRFRLLSIGSKSFFYGVVILFNCLIINSFCFGQNKKAVAFYDRGIDALQNGEMDKGIDFLLESYRADGQYMETLLSLGGAYNEVKQYDSSCIFYEKAKQTNPQLFLRYNLPYSISLAGLGKFRQALEAVELFLQLPNLNERSRSSAAYRQKNYAFALDYVTKHPQENYVFEPRNLGDNVNSPFSEYYPTISIDNKTLLFTRRTDGRREDFFESKNIANDSFSKAVALTGNINDEPSKGAINLSQDGQWLIFAGNFSGKGMGDFDLYISYKTANGWSVPQNLGPNINTEFWESSPSLSPDKTTLYFSSNRPGGFGSNDLYYSVLQPNGKFGPAQNMGANFNTSGEELAPFIHADNSSLYFTSSGLPGYGGQDLFLSRKDNYGHWSKPVNLGYPINTIENEGSLIVSADGLRAYYASDRSDTRGELDLYSFPLKKDMQPISTFYVKGKVVDNQSQQPIAAQIYLLDDSSQVELSHGFTNQDGKYLMTIPVGKAFTMIVESPGYLFASDSFHLRRDQVNSVNEYNIALQKIEAGAGITLQNILFDYNSAVLQPISQIVLDKVVRLLQMNPTLQIEIDGHTDNIGSTNFNEKLSAERAQTVVNYLITNGKILPNRLKSKGFGATKPIASNDSELGRAKNRRTELKVLKVG